MPKYYEDKVEDPRACAGIREDFKACLLQHDCVVKEGKKPSECLKEGHCKALQTTFFECKRSMVCKQSEEPAPQGVATVTWGTLFCSEVRVDTRSRFRGRKGY